MIMPNHIYAQATVLTSAGGRIDYITSKDRQEHLLFAGRTDPDFWSELVRFNKLKQAKNGAGDPDKLVEAREWIVPIPPDAWITTWNKLCEAHPDWSWQKVELEMGRYYAGVVEQSLNGLIKELERVEVKTVTAIHFSGRDKEGFGINPHAHMVLAERIKEEHPRLETRNQWRCSKGFRITAQDKEIREASGEKGFTLTLKGEPNPDYLFSDKLKCLTSGERMAFGDRFKSRLAEVWSKHAEKTQYSVFEKAGPYLAQNKVGKNKNQELLESIRLANTETQEYNRELGWQIDVLKDEGAEDELKTLLKNAQELKEQSKDVDPQLVKPVERWGAWRSFVRDLRRKLVNFWDKTFVEATGETKAQDPSVESSTSETTVQSPRNDRYDGLDR
jgi:hypothetical protein